MTVNPIQTILLCLKLLQATVIKKSCKARGANSVTLFLFCFAVVVVVVVVLLVAFLLCQYFAFLLLLFT